MDVLQWSRHYRCFPGQGGFDLAGLHPPRARGRIRRAALARGLQRRLPPGRPGADGRRRDALAADPRGGRRRRRVACLRRSALRGYAFVELAVEPASAGETQRTLHALGFSQAAQHRTKPVTLWQPGGCPGAAQRRRAGQRRHRRDRASRAPTPAARPSAPRRCSRRSSTAIAGRPRPTSRRWPRRTGPRSSSAAPTSASRRAGCRTSTRSRRQAARRRRASSASTTSRWPSRRTTSTRRFSSTARCSRSSRARASSSPRPTG